MSDALLAALSSKPSNEIAAFNAIKAGARLSPAEFAELSSEAIGLYAKLLGLVELARAGTYWVEASKKTAEHRDASVNHAKRIMAAILKEYGNLAAAVMPPSRKAHARSIELEDEREDRNHGLSR